MGKSTDLTEAFKEFHPGIVRFLSRLLGPAEAEDLAQEVFEKASTGVEGFRGDSKLSTWLYRIAVNTASDKLRLSSFKHTSQLSSLEDSAGIVDRDVWSGQPKSDTEEEAIQRQMSECVNGYIGTLSPDYKTVIVLKELEGLGNQEIADILKVSLETVKIRLHRARAALREQLEKGCTFYRNKQNHLACDRKLTSIESEKSA